MDLRHIAFPSTATFTYLYDFRQSPHKNMIPIVIVPEFVDASLRITFSCHAVGNPSDTRHQVFLQVCQSVICVCSWY